MGVAPVKGRLSRDGSSAPDLVRAGSRVARILGVGLLIAVAVALRTLMLGGSPLWFDEANSVLIAWRDARGVISALSQDGNPPVFYWLLHGWMVLFGSSEVAVRSLAVLFGLLSIAVVYGAGRLLFPARRAVALVAAVITAIGPLHVYYSRECRMYSFTPLLAVLVLVALHLALETRLWRYWVLHAALLALGLYTHNYFVFVAAVAPCAALLAPGRCSRGHAFGASLVSIALAAAVYAPWVPILVRQSHSGVSAWIPSFWHAIPPSAALLRSFEAMGVGGEFPSYLRTLSLLRRMLPAPGVWTAARVVGLVLGLGLVASGLVAALRSEEERSAGVRVALLLVLPLALPFAASFFVTPIYVVGRYEMIVFPAYALLASRGFWALMENAGRWRRAAGAAVAVLWLACAGLCDVVQLRAVTHPEMGDEKLLAEWIRDRTLAGDAVILPGYSFTVPEYYLKRWGPPVERLTFPPGVRDHPGWFDYEGALRDPAGTRRQADELATECRRVLEGGHPLFLAVTSVTPPPIVDWLRAALQRQLGPDRLEYKQEPLRTFYILAYGPLRR